MTKGSTSDTQALVERIRSHGFTCELGGQGHWQVTGTQEALEAHPDLDPPIVVGQMYGVFSATPSSARSLQNAMSDLRRSTGVDFRIQRKTPRKGDRPVSTTLDPRKVALLADRDRNDAAIKAAQARSAELASTGELAKLRAVLSSKETVLRDITDMADDAEAALTKEQRDQLAVDRAVAAAKVRIASGSNKIYPVMQAPRLLTFGVNEMKQLLEGTVCNTRPVQPSVVEKYRGRMRRGEWHVTHQGVAIDWHGCLVDGRQRFTAAIAEGVELTIYATYGVDPATFFAMDTGKSRTSADAISIADLHWIVDGKELKPNRTSLSAAVQMCLSLDTLGEDGKMPTRHQVEHTQYSPEQIVHGLLRDKDGYRSEGPYYDLGLYTGQAGALKRDAKLTMTAGYVGLFMAHRAFPEGPHGPWFQQLVSGANLAANSPALRLRNLLINSSAKSSRPGARGGLTTLAQYSLFIKTWNMYVAGRSIDSLRWREDEDIPAPYTPTGRSKRR